MATVLFCRGSTQRDGRKLKGVFIVEHGWARAQKNNTDTLCTDQRSRGKEGETAARECTSAGNVLPMSNDLLSSGQNERKERLMDGWDLKRLMNGWDLELAFFKKAARKAPKVSIEYSEALRKDGKMVSFLVGYTEAIPVHKIINNIRNLSV